MAEQLKETYGLLALTITLDMQREPSVFCTLEGTIDGEIVTLDEWDYPPAELGLPATIERRQTRYEGYTFHLPVYFVEDLQRILREQVDAIDALWLHLRPPYGYLDMIPWEALLQPALGIPMLRLPDFLLDPARHQQSSIHVAFCSSLPAAKSAFMAPQYLVTMAEALRMGSPYQTTIHFFADGAMVPELQRLCAANPALNAASIIYDPATASRYTIPDPTSRVVDPASTLQNPWLLWMRDSLHEQRIDIVHFLNHGYYAQDQGALAFAESPLINEDQRIARFVGTSELSTFLTHVGAWSVCFSATSDNYSRMGLRHLAHTLAQKRPGPLLHYEMDWDPNPALLQAAYRFLLGATNEPPTSPQLILYCHPGRLLNEQAGVESLSTEPFWGGNQGKMRGAQQPTSSQVEAVERLRGAGNIGNIYDETEQMPVWVAAADRHIEQRTLELSKRAAGEYIDIADPELDQSIETLSQIQQILRKAATETKGSQ